MSAYFVKPLAIVTTSGVTVATGAYFSRDYWIPSRKKEIKSISDVLKGRRLISSIDKASLAKQWEAEFESDAVSIKALLGDNSLSGSVGAKALEVWCSNQMFLNAEENRNILSNVEKYCLVRSVSSQLSRKGKHLLKVDSNDGWSSTYGKRKTANSNRDIVGLTGGTTWNQPNEGNDLVQVKKWCSENSGKEFLVSEQGTSDLYNNVLEWCTQEGQP